LNLTFDDVQAAYAGVRPVINTGKTSPSKESREHILWDEQGLLSVSGGKLTTFRLMAHDALEAAAARLPGRPRFNHRQPILDATPVDELLQTGKSEQLTPIQRLRLLGRYGADASSILEAAAPGELATIDGSPHLWAELRWAARAEGVVHLDDLLMRRVRLGLLLPYGGLPHMDSIRTIAQPELGWDDARWEQEEKRYTLLWHQSHELNF
jgi:glycerol-3-phosphate dehydrogenase